ncbi:MAG: SpoIIIAH-like family protein [Acutalibacteraceae bacterium]
MKTKFKKRHILTAALALLMASAIAINWFYSRNPVMPADNTGEETEKNLGDSIYVNGTTAENEENEEPTDSEDEEVNDASKALEFFAEAELKRTKAHDEALDEIQKLLEKGGNDEKIEQLLLDYTSRIKLETDTENLIKAKIDTECLVIINGDSAEVVVGSEAIDELYLLQISEIVSNQTEIPAEKIIIIQAK